MKMLMHLGNINKIFSRCTEEVIQEEKFDEKTNADMRTLN